MRSLGRERCKIHIWHGGGGEGVPVKEDMGVNCMSENTCAGDETYKGRSNSVNVKSSDGKCKRINDKH